MTTSTEDTHQQHSNTAYRCCRCTTQRNPQNSTPQSPQLVTHSHAPDHGSRACSSAHDGMSRCSAGRCGTQPPEQGEVHSAQDQNSAVPACRPTALQPDPGSGQDGRGMLMPTTPCHSSSNSTAPFHHLVRHDLCWILHLHHVRPAEVPPAPPQLPAAYIAQPGSLPLVCQTQHRS